MVIGIELVGADTEDCCVRYLLQKLHGGTIYLMVSMTLAVVRLVVGCSCCHSVGMVAGCCVVVAIGLARHRCHCCHCRTIGVSGDVSWGLWQNFGHNVITNPQVPVPRQPTHFLF